LPNSIKEPEEERISQPVKTKEPKKSSKNKTMNPKRPKERPCPKNSVGKKKLGPPNNKETVEVVTLSPPFPCWKTDSESFTTSKKNCPFNMPLIVHSIIKDVTEGILS